MGNSAGRTWNEYTYSRCLPIGRGRRRSGAGRPMEREFAIYRITLCRLHRILILIIRFLELVVLVITRITEIALSAVQSFVWTYAFPRNRRLKRYLSDLDTTGVGYHLGNKGILSSVTGLVSLILDLTTCG
jgi:hypothetical protein